MPKGSIFSQGKIERALILFAILFLTNACNKEKFDLPVVLTGEVFEVTSEGVIFRAKVIAQGSAQIIDHGFVWATSGSPNLENNYSVSLGTFTSGLFQAEITSGLQEGTSYLVRAYVKTYSSIIYGRTTSFRALGSKAPEISNFSPKNGIWGDTLTIEAKNLSQLVNDVKVYVGNNNAQIIDYQPESLKVMIPNTLVDTIAPISLTMFNNQVFASDSFIVDPPIITQIYPEGGIKDSVVYINGRGFHPNMSHNSVYLGDMQLQVTYSSRDHLRAKITSVLDHGNYPVRVKSLGREATDPSSFTFYQPWTRLNDLPNVVRYIFKIEERIFFTEVMNTQPGGNPYIIFKEFLPDTQSFVIKATPPINNCQASFSTTSFGYLVTNSPYPVGSLYRYNPISNQWSYVSESPIQRNLDGYSTFNIDGNVYFCGGYYFQSGGTAVYLDEVIKFDHLTETLQQMSSFPDGQLHWGRGFSIMGKGYVTLGRIWDVPFGNLNIFEYSPINDSWTVINSFEGILPNSNLGRRNPIAMVIDNKAYIFGGIRVSGAIFTNFYEMFSFDPITNQIRRLPNIHFESFSGSSFTIGGKGYFWLGNNFWEFDPTKLPPWLH